MTSGTFEIPLQPENQQFTVSLAGVTYTMKLQWCAPAQCWNLDISDSQQNPIVQGLQLITGADLLAQLEYLGLGGALIVQSDFDVNAVPDYASLGSTGHLFFVTP